MAHDLTTARPYAKAIFECANTTNNVVEWSAMLVLLSYVVQDQKVVALLNDPRVATNTWNDFFISVCDAVLPNETTTIKPMLINVIKLLIENKRLELLSDIHLVFERYLAQQQGIIEAQASSAFPLNAAQTNKLKAALEERFASKVNLAFKIDPELIGGFVVRSQDWVLDASTKGVLERFNQALLGSGRQ